MTARVRSIALVLSSLLWMAASASCGRDVATGSRFQVLGAAVVRDTATGLEWTRHDDGVGLDWFKAEAYCRSLSTDGGRGWRLPTIEELAGLHDARLRTPCGDTTCGIDPVFTLTSPYVWSATAPGEGARTYLDFQYGTRLSPSIRPILVRRVLCIR